MTFYRVSVGVCALPELRRSMGAQVVSDPKGDLVALCRTAMGGRGVKRRTPCGKLAAFDARLGDALGRAFDPFGEI